MSDRSLADGLRALQKLLACPGDPLAHHTMVRSLSDAVAHASGGSGSDGFDTVMTVVRSLDGAGRPLAGRAMLSKAFISARPVVCGRLVWGRRSLDRTARLYAGSTSDPATQRTDEDPGFWRHYTLDVDRTVSRLLDAVIAGLTLLSAATGTRLSNDTDTDADGQDDGDDDDHDRVAVTVADDDAVGVSRVLRRYGRHLLVELCGRCELLRNGGDGEMHRQRAAVLASLLLTASSSRPDNAVDEASTKARLRDILDISRDELYDLLVTRFT
ncbi:hypothetical protein PYCC9005_000160 [Savitreella phatthalungensis]